MRRWNRILVVTGFLAAVCAPSGPARANAPALGVGDVIEVSIAGDNGVPDDAVAAVLNVTAVDATAPGFLTVYPCDAAKPDASNVNYEPHTAVPNLVVARLSAAGTVCVWSSAPASAIVDVSGWFPAGSDYVPLVPARVLDSRFGNGTATGKVAAGATVHLALSGRGGLPVTGVAAVVLNTTATNADGAGFATVFPCDASRPDASNLNYAPGGASPNLVVAQVAPDGTVCLFVSAATDLIADLSGYFAAGSSYSSVVPARVLDTRFGVGAVAGKVAADGVVRLQLPPGWPAVVLNTTAANASADGFVTVYPCDVPRPDASNLNFRAGQAIPNLVVSPLAADGTVCLYSSAAVDLIADMNGSFTDAVSYQPMVPVRVLDGRHCDVAVYTVAGEIFSFDFDTGYYNDLGPTTRPGQALSLADVPFVVTNDCYVYFKAIALVNGTPFRQLYRMSVKALNPTPELAPGEANPPLNRAHLVGSSPDGRTIWLSLQVETKDRFVKVDTATGQVEAIHLLQQGEVFSVTSDGRRALMRLSSGAGIAIIDLPSGAAHVMATIGFPSIAFQLSPDGTMEAEQAGFATPPVVTVRNATDGTVLFTTPGELAGWLGDGEVVYVDDDVMYAADPHIVDSEIVYLDLIDVTSYSEGPNVWWPRPIE